MLRNSKAFADALFDNGVLTQTEGAIAPAPTTAQELAELLLRREKLTPFQTDEILNESGTPLDWDRYGKKRGQKEKGAGLFYLK